MNGAALPTYAAMRSGSSSPSSRSASRSGAFCCRSSTRRFGSQFEARWTAACSRSSSRSSVAATSSAWPGRSRSASSTRSRSSSSASSRSASRRRPSPVSGSAARWKWLLARPISRRGLLPHAPVPRLPFVAVTVTALLAGGIAGSVLRRGHRRTGVSRLPLLWLNGVLLFGTFAAIGLAASVSFDRLPPALGLTIGVAVLMFFFEVLATFWPAAECCSRTRCSTT